MRRLATRSEDGYTLAELLVVVAIIGIMALLAVPFLTTYIPSASVNYAAREVQGGLNRAKLLAVSTRCSIRVQIVAGGYQFVKGNTGGTCDGTIWTGPGTDGAGTFQMGAGLTLAQNSGQSPIFNQFGAAPQTGSFKVTASGGPQQTISVNAAGGVSIP